MNKTFFKLLLITATVTIINTIATIIYLLKMPDTVPVHFNIDFICDRVGSKWNGLFPSAILVFLIVMFIISERRGKNTEQNCKPMSATILLSTLLIVAVNWIFLMMMGSGVGLGEKIEMKFGWLMMLITGFLILIIGNYMPVIRQNRTLGIKLPWTLKNEKCWILTHRFAGKLYVITGLIAISLTLAVKVFDLNYNVITTLYICLLIPCIIIIPIIYSYLHRND